MVNDGRHMIDEAFSDDAPVMYVRGVAILPPDMLVQLEGGPIPLGFALRGLIEGPGYAVPGELIVGVTVELAGQIIDSLRASAEDRGVAVALVHATDQAEAARKAHRAGRVK